MRTPIYLEVKVEIDYDESIMTKDEAIQEAVSSFDYDFKLNSEYTPIKVTDTEITEILDATYNE